MEKILLQYKSCITVLFFFMLLGACTPSKKSAGNKGGSGTGDSLGTVAEKGLAKRVYYDYQKQALYASNNGSNEKSELEAPLRRKAGRDIVIEIYNYNPLKEQVTVETTSTDFFLADTGSLAKSILIPKIANTAEGDKAKTEVLTGKNPKKLDESNLAPLGFNSVHESIEAKTDCDKMKGLMASVDLAKTKMEGSVRTYKSFISEIDVIKNDYEYLKEQETLEGNVVENRLSESFISGMNNFLTAQPGLSTLGSNARTLRLDRLTDLEGTFYRNTIAHTQTLDELAKEVDKLKGGCDGFIELYKKASGKIDEVRKAIKEFDASRNDKILPGFKSNLVLYAKMRSFIGNSPSLPVRLTVENDLHSITVFKKPVGADAKTEHSKIKIEPVRGWKLDVAGGIFVGGVSDYKFAKKTIDSIYTKKYLVNGIIRDTTVQEKFTAIYKEKQTPLSYGGMFFLHAHSQNPSKFNGGIYLGFGAMFNDQSRWAGALGGSLIIGKKQRFNINPGLLLSQVDRLSKTNTVDTWTPGVIDNIPVYKSWRLGWILGFSWNIK